MIVIEFPDRDSASGWYDSPGHQQIRPLRTRNTSGWVILVNGVTDNHSATDVLAGSVRQRVFLARNAERIARQGRRGQ